MGKKYKHITEKQRQKLHALKQQGESVGKIAEELGLHRASVYRELKRNVPHKENGYLPDAAHQAAQKRRNRPGPKIERFEGLQKLILEGFAMELSPEAIAGRSKLEGFKQTISSESIYKWIYGAGKKHNLIQQLLRKKRRRGRRTSRKIQGSRIKNRISIHERPDNFETEFGHWEGDTIHFSGRKGAILTLYERQSKLVIGIKMDTRTAEETTKSIEKLFAQLPEGCCKSITFDNGLEFANHEQIQETLGVDIFFCDSYASWQKGGVENVNGIIRRSVHKKAKESEFTDQDIQKYLLRINGMPRKSLGFKTALESFLQNVNPNAKLLTLINHDVALRN